MSIGDHKARPSAPQGGHPLVASRSAPTLTTGSPGLATPLRMDLPAPEPDSPRAGPRAVRQLHPVVTLGDGSVLAPRQDAKQADASDSKAQPGRDGQAPVGQGALVRFVGGFIISSQARLQQDNDALTALVDSIHRCAQDQPDSAMPSSGEATPRD